MTRDLSVNEITPELDRIMTVHMKVVDDAIKDGKLSKLQFGCIAYDDTLMLSVANKMCGVNADFIYFYTLNTKDKSMFKKDREVLKDITGGFLEFIQDEQLTQIDDNELLETNVISTSRPNIPDCHFICLLMKHHPLEEV